MPDELPGYKVIYPIHKNPLVRAAAETKFSAIATGSLIEPLEVLIFTTSKQSAYNTDRQRRHTGKSSPLSESRFSLYCATQQSALRAYKAGTLKLVGNKQ